MRCGERHRQVLPTNQISVIDVPSRYTHATPVPPLSITHPMLVTDHSLLFPSFFLFFLFFCTRVWEFGNFWNWEISKFEIWKFPSSVLLKFKNSFLYSILRNLEISLKFLLPPCFPKYSKFPSSFSILWNLKILLCILFPEIWKFLWSFLSSLFLFWKFLCLFYPLKNLKFSKIFSFEI